MKEEMRNFKRNLSMYFSLLVLQRLINNDGADNETFQIMSAVFYFLSFLFFVLCLIAHFFFLSF